MKILLNKTIFLLLLSSFFGCTPEVERSKEQKWLEDINYYHDTLVEKHINLFHTLSEQTFNTDIDKLKAGISELSESQIVMELMRITRMVGDGHTGFSIMSQTHQHFPMRFKLFDGEVRVIKSTKEHQRYLKNKLVAIDDMPIQDILTKLTSIAQNVENEHSLKESLVFTLTQDEVLHGISITRKLGNAKFSFEDEEGQVNHLLISSVDMGSFIANTSYGIKAEKRFFDKSVTHSNRLFLSYDPDIETALLNFAEYGSIDEMTDFAAEVKGFLNEHRVRNLIIDMRANSGGSFFIGLYLISELLQVESLDWERGIYTLIGNYTFSAGMSNATHFKQMMNAKLIGEPTGANPNGYQEIGRFQLPNSQYSISYSKRYYRFQDINTQGVLPDVTINTSWQDFKDGHDMPLEWVVKEINDRL